MILLLRRRPLHHGRGGAGGAESCGSPIYPVPLTRSRARTYLGYVTKWKWHKHRRRAGTGDSQTAAPSIVVLLLLLLRCHLRHPSDRPTDRTTERPEIPLHDRRYPISSQWLRRNLEIYPASRYSSISRCFSTFGSTVAQNTIARRCILLASYADVTSDCRFGSSLQKYVTMRRRSDTLGISVNVD